MQPVRRDLIEEFVGRITSEGGKMPPLVMVGVDGIPLWAQGFVLVSFLANGFVIKPTGFDSEFEITDFEMLEGYEFQIVRVRVVGATGLPDATTPSLVTVGIEEPKPKIAGADVKQNGAAFSWWQLLINRLRGGR